MTSPILVAGPTRVAVVDQPLDAHRPVELGKHLGRARGAGDDAVGAGHDIDGGIRISRDEGRGQVTERADVLGERGGDERPHEVHRRVEVGHRDGSCSVVRERHELGSGGAREHETAEERRRRGGMVFTGVGAARLAPRGRGAHEHRAHGEQVRALDVGGHHAARARRPRAPGSRHSAARPRRGS